MEPSSLDWSSAQVHEGVLSVELRGERPEGWNDSFAATATMLGGGGDWDEVGLKNDRVTVTGVGPGMEDKLHHFLESVVRQANADHTPEDDGEDEDQERREEEDQGDSGDDSDSDLTARFRAFAD